MVNDMSYAHEIETFCQFLWSSWMHVKAKLRIVYCERLSNCLTGLKHEKICSLLYDNKTIIFINFDVACLSFILDLEW